MKKKTETTQQITASGERFTAILKDAKKYPLLSVHDFEGVKYQVNAVMLHEDGIAVEFVKVQ